jgi:hypothetical protein
MFSWKSENGAQKKLKKYGQYTCRVIYFQEEVILLCEFLENFFAGVFEDSFWDMMSLQALQGSGAVFPKLFARGRLLISKNNQGFLHLCSHKYSVSG